jgi:hypothetical protein
MSFTSNLKLPDYVTRVERGLLDLMNEHFFVGNASIKNQHKTLAKEMNISVKSVKKALRNIQRYDFIKLDNFLE